MVDNKIFCYFSDVKPAISGLVFLLIVQFVYTIIVWATLLKIHWLNSVYLGLMMIVVVAAFSLICAYSCVMDNDTNRSRIFFKCMPIASFMMVLFSFLPFFAALLQFIDNPINDIGGPISVFIISFIFTVIWLQAFCVISK